MVTTAHGSDGTQPVVALGTGIRVLSYFGTRVAGNTRLIYLL